ncbi:hypothetical protein BT69DRAFT_1316683 [Atractiella rhizophila]|nr:hypothetical protein BT69DRAFT_1316683 [Atractiella rhizophila]
MTKTTVHTDPRRTRNSRACNYCRESKGRCDGQPPVNKPGEIYTIQRNPCSRCRDTGHICEWAPSRRRGRYKHQSPPRTAAAARPRLASTAPVVDEGTWSEAEEDGTLEKTEVYRLFPAVFAPLEAICTSPSSSSDGSESDRLIELPMLPDLLAFLSSCLESVAQPFSPKHSVLGPRLELLDLVDVFYTHVHHLVRILPSRDVFLSQHFNKCSPFLLAAICAFAQPFYDGSRGISTDYFSLGELLFAEEGTATPDLEKIIGDIFLLHVGYGYGISAASVAHMERAASIALENDIYGKSLVILEKRQEDQAEFDCETVYRTVAELFHADLDCRYTIGGCKSAFTSIDDPIGLLRTWMDDPDEMLQFSIRTAHIAALVLVPPPNEDVPRIAQFSSLETRFLNLIAIAEEKWASLARIASSRSDIESWEQMYSREGYYFALHVLTTTRIDMNRAYNFPALSLNYKICSLEPSGVYDTLESLRSLSLHNPPQVEENRKVDIQPVSFFAIQNMVTSAEGSITLMQETARIQREKEKKKRFQSPPSSQRGEVCSKVALEEIHSPFLICCHITSSFAILLGIVSLIQVVISQPDLLGNGVMRRSIHLKILAFTSELDYLEGYLTLQGKVWPIALMKLKRLKECRGNVMSTFEETLSKIGFP